MTEYKSDYDTALRISDLTLENIRLIRKVAALERYLDDTIDDLNQSEFKFRHVLRENRQHKESLVVYSRRVSVLVEGNDSGESWKVLSV